MKRIFAVILMLCMLCSLPIVQVSAAEGSAAKDFRAVWVSTVLNLDFPTKKALSVADMKKEVDDTVALAVQTGLNAIVLQVRPNADALYASDIFPWSEYLTGSQGVAPAGGFDPLAYWVAQCHAAGLELHAWINPYRVTHTAHRRTNVNVLATKSPARQNPSWVVSHENALYFNPGLPQVRQLVIDGVKEIITKYDVDGIHLDDYFYPGTNFNDDAAYKQYGNGLSRDDWRRENVNTLIKDMQAMIRATKPSVRFGVSPFAIWQNKTSSPLGSDTRGAESYKTMYADTRRWVQEGWVDYICPQIYWLIGYDIADYQKVLSWWADVCRGTDVDLYVGHAAYREAENQKGWAGEIVRQLTLNKTSFAADVQGAVFFRSGLLKGSVGTQITQYYAQNPVQNQTPGQTQPQTPSTSPNPIPTIAPTQPQAPVRGTTLTVAQPAQNVTTTGTAYNILGTCDPTKPLYINGKLVTDRTADGFFSVYVGISRRASTFTFTQEGQTTVTRVITGVAPAAATKPAAAAVITSVAISTRTHITVSAASAWLYPSPTTDGGSSWMATTNQRDNVIATTKDGKWVKLSSGFWIERENVSMAKETNLSQNLLSQGVYIKEANEDIFQWTARQNPVTHISQSGRDIIIRFGLQSVVPPHQITNAQLAQYSMFSAITSGIENGTPFLRLTLKDGERVEGMYTSFANGVFRIHCKRTKALAAGDKPLAGFHFVIDAGHGGSDSGAKGPMGATFAEKHLNLINANKLSDRLAALGATVTRTRTADTALSLYQRTEASRAANPDMFISVHANSMSETTDGRTVRGFSVWYRNPMSKPLADALLGSLYSINPATNRRELSNQSNLYVTRPSWTPSVILEASFMCNIQDFAWLVDANEQDKMADATVEAILKYYGK